MHFFGEKLKIPTNSPPFLPPYEQKKAETLMCIEFQLNICGERGIRTPGPVTVNGFQDRRIRPLCHLSAAKIQSIQVQAK